MPTKVRSWSGHGRVGRLVIFPDMGYGRLDIFPGYEGVVARQVGSGSGHGRLYFRPISRQEKVLATAGIVGTSATAAVSRVGS